MHVLVNLKLKKERIHACACSGNGSDGAQGIY